MQVGHFFLTILEYKLYPSVIDIWSKYKYGIWKPTFKA